MEAEGLGNGLETFDGWQVASGTFERLKSRVRWRDWPVHAAERLGEALGEF